MATVIPSTANLAGDLGVRLSICRSIIGAPRQRCQALPVEEALKLQKPRADYEIAITRYDEKNVAQRP